MNVEDNHLVEIFNEEDEETAKGVYKRVPHELSLSAKLELMGKSETYVGMEATSEIATWAKNERKKLGLQVKKRKGNKLYCK